MIVRISEPIDDDNTLFITIKQNEDMAVIAQETEIRVSTGDNEWSGKLKELYQILYPLMKAID